MAEPGTDWLQMMLGLPPSLQGIAALGAGLGLAYLMWRKFRHHFTNPEAPQREIIVGEAAKITDMKPVRDLAENIDLMTLQLMKNDAGQSAILNSLSVLADLLGQHLVDMRDEREVREDRAREQAAEQRGYEKGLATRRSPPRKPRLRPATKPD